MHCPSENDTNFWRPPYARQAPLFLKTYTLAAMLSMVWHPDVSTCTLPSDHGNPWSKAGSRAGTRLPKKNGLLFQMYTERVDDYSFFAVVNCSGHRASLSLAKLLLTLSHFKRCRHFDIAKLCGSSYKGEGDTSWLPFFPEVWYHGVMDTQKVHRARECFLCPSLHRKALLNRESPVFWLLSFSSEDYNVVHQLVKNTRIFSVQIFFSLLGFRIQVYSHKLWVFSFTSAILNKVLRCVSFAQVW